MRRTPLKRTKALARVGRRGKKLTADDRSFKATIVAERGNRCEVCGSTGVLDLHHILTKAAYPELRYDPKNVVLLCREHHDQAHGREWK